MILLILNMIILIFIIKLWFNTNILNSRFLINFIISMIMAISNDEHKVKQQC